MRLERSVMTIAVAIATGLGLSTAALALPTEAERKQAWDDANTAATHGPADVALAGQAVMHLPAGEVFVPRAQALRVLHVMGNPGDDPELQGVIFPVGDKGGWFLVVDWKPAGYVKDDDAKNWNADDLLKSYREGTEGMNEERAKMGVPPLEITGWAEPPRYDAATQRLVWAMKSREKGDHADGDEGVNYNTYALGRDGYFSMNVIGDLAQLDMLKPVAAQQLGALEFDGGKRYADFNEKTDHVAEYGLAALVVGVAAKKLGLLALGLAFFAKFAKVIFIALAVFGGGFMKYFKRKPGPESPSTALVAAAPAAADLPPREVDAGTAAAPPSGPPPAPPSAA